MSSKLIDNHISIKQYKHINKIIRKISKMSITHFMKMFIGQ